MIFRKMKRILIMCFLFSQFTFIASPCLANTKGSLSDKDVVYLTDYLHCSNVTEMYKLDFDYDDSKYAWILWSYDCKSEEYITIAKHHNGRYSEIERLSSDKFLGSKIEAKRVKNNNIDFLFEIYSFEPNDMVDQYYLKVFNLNEEKKMLSAWSCNTPIIDDLNGDGILDVAIYKNAFAIDLPGQPNLPIILSINTEIEIKDLFYYQDFVREELKSVKEAITYWKNSCKSFKDGSCPDLISARLNSLESLEKYLSRIIVRETKGGRRD